MENPWPGGRYSISPRSSNQSPGLAPQRICAPGGAKTSTLKSYNSKNGETCLPSLDSLLSALLIYRSCCSFRPPPINNMHAELLCVCRNLCGSPPDRTLHLGVQR